ncbi:MAG: FAD-binding oxidoreductase [Alphaproteobacteria bacterium]|nr:MAG: FAD-binding oxidoreductase [Alphaproteobacteria bacterium]
MHVVIIGGGIMGASTAWWLTRRPDPPGVTVVEPDPALKRSATMLSAGGIRQQFSKPDNVRASAFGWWFLSRARELLGEDVGLRRRGYLILAGPAEADALARAVAMQRAEGAATELLTPGAIAARFPWLSVAGVAAGAIGRDEGWFDPAALHRGLKRGAQAAGARWIRAEASGFEVEAGRIGAVLLADGGRLHCDAAVNAAGPRAGQVAAWAGIALPVRPDIRTVFHLTAPDSAAIAAAAPLIVDPAGVWVRPEGAGFIAGAASARQPDDPWSLPVDWNLFEARIWPVLARRVPAFERLRVAGAWAGPYDWNEVDQDGILGADPACPNLFHITGFSGHGLQHAPAAGRALAAMILPGTDPGAPELAGLDIARLRAGSARAETAII